MSKFNTAINSFVLCALAGFSIALATNSDFGDAGDTSSRAVGSRVPLDFANPLISGGTDRDLGDAVVGSTIIRLVRAKGGVPPYQFTAGSVPSKLALLQNGMLSGVLDASLKPAGSSTFNPLRFFVTVIDTSMFVGSSNTKTEVFRLTVLNSNTFRFAHSALSDGVQFQSYSERLPVVNGVLPISFSASSISINGTAAARLEDAGLTLSPDGSIFGTPLVSGTISFLATATDKNGASARGRSGNSLGQVFQLKVTANSFLSSMISATAITIKSGAGSKDSIAYKGVANLQGKTPVALRGQEMSFQIGPYQSPTPNFDTKGSAKSGKLTAKVNKTGAFTVAVKGDSVDLKLGTPRPLSVDLAVQIRLGDLLLGAEVLRFVVKSNANGSVTLTYKPTAQANLGGAFQLMSVKGKDDKAATGDSWMVTFMNRAPLGTTFSNITRVDVAIGTGFDKTASSVKNLNGKVSFKGNRSAAEVVSFSADLIKGKGVYTTGILPSTTTGIPLSAEGGSGAYSTTIAYQNSSSQTVTGGIGGMTIYVKGTSGWASGR